MADVFVYHPGTDSYVRTAPDVPRIVEIRDFFTRLAAASGKDVAVHDMRVVAETALFTLYENEGFEAASQAISTIKDMIAQRVAMATPEQTGVPS